LNGNCRREHITVWLNIANEWRLRLHSKPQSSAECAREEHRTPPCCDPEQECCGKSPPVLLRNAPQNIVAPSIIRCASSYRSVYWDGEFGRKFRHAACDRTHRGHPQQLAMGSLSGPCSRKKRMALTVALRTNAAACEGIVHFVSYASKRCI